MFKKITILLLGLVVLGGCTTQITDTQIDKEVVIEKPAEEETMDIQIYFSSEKNNEGLVDCRKTEAVTRTIPKTTALANASLEQLFIGPTEEEMDNGLVKFNMRNENMSDYIKRIFVKNNIIYIDWVDFRNNENPFFYNSSSGGCNVIPPLEDTLLQFPNIDNVVYAFEGDPEAYYEWIQMGCNPDDNLCDPTPFQ